MPIYEYQCAECGETFEKFLRTFSEQEELTCPRCGSKDVRKAISLFGLGSATSTGSSSCSPTSPGSL
jgi:putative FmdB family regulatory protein